MYIKEDMVLVQHLLSKPFIERWLDKAKGYNEELLEDCFDKFFTLFVAFNRLYNNASALIQARAEIKKLMEDPVFKPEFDKSKNIGDRKASTVCVAYFLADKTGDILNANKATLSSFIEIIPEFNICLKDGAPQKKKDEELLYELQSADNKTALFALLKTVYHIRCNTFHGEKDMVERQKKLLQVSNVFLKSIIEAMNNSFNANIGGTGMNE